MGVGDTVFMYVKHGNMFVVAVASGNAQAAMTFQFLHSVVTVLKSYFGAFDEDSIRNNFVLIYELLDEVLDYGYPQNCTTDVLKMYITQEGNKSASLAKKEMGSSVTIQATGAISWRKEGIKYRKNELFIDVVEHCNLMMSSKGTILRNDVSGVILVKCYLSGTPECKFGLNDKLPFRVLPVVKELGRTRLEINVKIKSMFTFKLFATNVVIKIPLPKNTAVATVNAASGKCKYEPDQGGVIWKLRRFPGDTEYFMSGEVEMMATMGGKAWSRPPITMDFQVPMFAASGLHVRFLKVIERSQY